MNADFYIHLLAGGPARLRALTEGLDPAILRFRPVADQWSIIEIIGHMVDEESADFRARTRLTLEEPESEWPPIDPPLWVREHGHQKREAGDLLRAFEAERAASLQWLRGLRDPDWRRTHTHPKFGAFSAGDMLVSWAAHDILHLRQITKRLYQFAASATPGARIEYAGDFT